MECKGLVVLGRVSTPAPSLSFLYAYIYISMYASVYKFCIRLYVYVCRFLSVRLFYDSEQWELIELRYFLMIEFRSDYLICSHKIFCGFCANFTMSVSILLCVYSLLFGYVSVHVSLSYMYVHTHTYIFLATELFFHRWCFVGVFTNMYYLLYMYTYCVWVCVCIYVFV